MKIAVYFCEDDGYVLEICEQEGTGQELPVGTVLARVVDTEEELSRYYYDHT